MPSRPHLDVLTVWRLSVAALLVVCVGLPLLVPFVEWWRAGGGSDVWSERARIALLASNTLLLVGGLADVLLGLRALKKSVVSHVTSCQPLNKGALCGK